LNTQIDLEKLMGLATDQMISAAKKLIDLQRDNEYLKEENEAIKEELFQLQEVFSILTEKYENLQQEKFLWDRERT